MTLDPYFSARLKQDFAKTDPAYKALKLVLEQFDPTEANENTYLIAKDIAIKYPNAARLAYKSLKQHVQKITMHAYGFMFTPHNDWYDEMITPSSQFKRNIMYEFGFRLLQCMFNSYSQHSGSDVYNFIKHVNTCLCRGYVTKLTWNDPTISQDVDKAIEDLITITEFNELKVQYELYPSASHRDHLYEIMTFYNGIYLYEYVGVNSIKATITMDKIKRLAYNDPRIIPSKFLHQVAANIALTYDIYDPQYNPTTQGHDPYTSAYLSQ